jgi:hypothetical protein
MRIHVMRQAQHERPGSGEHSIEHLMRGRLDRNTSTYSLVTWQTVLLFWTEHSHLMAGLKLGSLSMFVPSVAAPVQGSPLMFHADDAVWPSLANTAFTAAAANHPHQQQK